MKIEVRSDHVLISGYVNAVGRDSRPLPSPTGKFVEMVEPGVFRAALERAQDVQLLLNHDKNRVLGSVAQGNLALCEDNIGLRAECTVTDADVIEKARKGELRGWSFGMYVNNADMEERADNIPRRHLRDIDIFEVSLIDKSKLPCYAGTSVECRADSEIMAETRSIDDEAEIKCLIPPDLSDYERRLNEIYLRAYERRLAELRYNPYHDPSNGRFTSGSGGIWGGILFVGKGQKGKGQYVINQQNFNVAPQATITPDPNAKMDTVIRDLQASNIQYNEVSNLTKSLTSDEIIDKISGGDTTSGSCVSLAYAYIGNEFGYDVHDFRGGESQKYFSAFYNEREICQSVGGIEFKGKDAIQSTFDVLNSNVTEGKTYFLGIGKHAAIVRKNGGKFEYLELQDNNPGNNGFHELTSKTLRKRFEAKKSNTFYGMKLDQRGVLIESEKLARNSDFKKMLGYINTPINEQKKGTKGYVK